MQRCFFFVILLWGNFLIPAQATDVLKTELSLWLTESNSYADAIKATARLEVSVLKATDELNFRATNLLISEVRLSEGRLKERYRFTHDNDVLIIHDLNLEAGERVELFFDYHILPDIDREKRMSLEAENLLVFNPEGLRSGRPSPNIVGSYYPALARDASILLVDLSVPEHYNSKLPAELEFVTDNQDGSRSHFWRSNNPIDPVEFYLMAGDFESLEGASLQSYLQKKEDEQIALHAAKLRHLLTPVLSYLELTAAINNEELLNIDHLSRSKLKGFYLEAADVNSPPYTFRLEQAGFLYHYQYDTSKASAEHLKYYLQICGEHWSKDLLDKHWDSFEQQRAPEQKLTLYLSRRVWFEQNEWSQSIDSARAERRFWQLMEKSREPPVLRLDYSFSYKNRAQYIDYVQDSVLAPQYEIPIRVLQVSSGDSTYSLHWITDKSGQLVFEFNSPPDYIEASFGEYFPGMVMERRPESHYLYQLSHTRDAIEKRRALQLLFNTENQNLFATVVGIALRDEDAEMRSAALNRVDLVNETGLMKLRSTITQMSQNDPDSANRTLARAIAEKHYGLK